ncbi:MAG: hypothetical protein KDC32_03730, partial [Saprospiraceae bacterium]|nr:hypothetical protein [Saprospiraceae bacterium]
CSAIQPLPAPDASMSVSLPVPALPAGRNYLQTYPRNPWRDCSSLPENFELLHLFTIFVAAEIVKKALISIFA